MSFTLHGVPASCGIAIGTVHLVSLSRVEVIRRFICEEDVEKERQRFLNSQKRVLGELERLRKKFIFSSDDNDLEVFLNLHTLLLKDSMLIDAVLSMIRENRCNAEWALTQQMLIILDQFDKIDDEYFHQRKYDVEQVVQCLLRALAEEHIVMPLPSASGIVDQVMIVVAEDITPADMLEFHSPFFGGFITVSGGGVSHTAIAARSLGMPAIVGVSQAYLFLKHGDCVILDGELGVVIVNPSLEIYDQYRLLQTTIDEEKYALRRLRDLPARTIDNQIIKLFANVDLPADAENAYQNGADGIGLFRTEFLFMNRQDMPDEAEQYQAYLRVITSMCGRCTTFRTVDFGGDKIGAVFNSSSKESSTVLGLRAIRLCLIESNLFLTQLRAILRASAHGDVRILIPMITHLHQIDQTLLLINQAKKQCEEQGFAYDRNIKIGAMIEVPAAAIAFPFFVNRFDFFSIGTNDLIQYTLAVDRTDSNVAHLYDPLHPAILHLIARLIKQAHASGKPITVCGEMAGDLAFTSILLGLGLTEFSIHPSKLLSIKKKILQVDKGAIEKRVATLLYCVEPEVVSNILDSLI